MRLILPLVLLSLPALGHAQVKSVSPKDAVGAGANSRGVSGLGYGFNVSAHRLQQLHDTDSFSHGTGTLPIRQIAFRMPANQNTGTQGGAKVEIAVQLSLAATGVTANVHNKSFSQNLDASTSRQVFRKKTVDLPTLGTPTMPSTGFDFMLKFDTAPFVYLPNQKRTLVLDIFNYSLPASTNNYFVDGWTRARSGLGGTAQCALLYQPLPGASSFGQSIPNGRYTGCSSSARVLASHTSMGESLTIDGPHTFSGSAGLANGAGVMTFGLQALSATIPGTSCLLVNDLVILFPFAADTAGDAHVPFFIPPQTNYVGIGFYTQFVFLDLPANAVGLVTSNGLVHRIGAGFGDQAQVDTIGRSLIVEFQ